MVNYYHVLGVPEFAPEQEIHDAYMSLTQPPDGISDGRTRDKDLVGHILHLPLLSPFLDIIPHSFYRLGRNRVLTGPQIGKSVQMSHVQSIENEIQ